MARRSPANPRYQRHTGPSGKTRRSASSAKVKRAGEARAAKRTRFGLPPATPEMKRWRRIWWALIGVALAFAATMLIPGVRENRVLATTALALEFAALGTAIYIDWKRIRPLRMEQMERAKQERKAREGKR
ncbi:MAG: hypothetical protein IBX62_07865 [Coriobacteriia bacterium]|nr:hypothetical protein [Coriobacteriia bacterium]